MAEEKPIYVYGNIRTPEQIQQDIIDEMNGIVRYHETTWLEWEIPQELERKLTKMIKRQLVKFREKCICEHCKEQRKNKL